MLARKKKQNNQVSATVADDYLILSLPNAVEPIIWRKSLEKIGSTTFEVKKVANKDQYNLTLQKTKTTSEKIATFDNKEDALLALNAASEAFHGHSKAPNLSKQTDNISAQSLQATPQKASSNKWLWLFIATIAVVGLYAYMGKLIPNTTITGETTTMTATSASTAPTSAAESTGVPVSADDFFNGVE